MRGQGCAKSSRLSAALVAVCLISVLACPTSSATAGLHDLTVVSVTAVKPYAPVYFVVTGLASGRTGRSASVAAFKITVRNGGTSYLSRIKVTLIVDRTHLAPLVKTQTLAVIGPNGISTVSFPRFPGAVFTATTNLNIAFGNEPSKVYAVSVPWA